jgi:hypothetical protein
MCTMISHTVGVQGAAKGRPGWFRITQATVAFDHPVNGGLEHAVLLDFTNYDLDPAARVAVELDLSSARALVKQLTAAMEMAEASGFASGSESWR